MAKAVPPYHYGMQFGGDSEYLSATQMDWIHRSGAKFYRVNIHWAHYQPGDWTRLDTLFGLAAERDITILPTFYGNKYGEGHQFPLPGEFSEWTDFVTKVVQRYGYGGTFWAGRPRVLPPPAWEVWNEPNFGLNNPGNLEPKPKQYMEFLATTATAIRLAQNPWPKILIGGLFWDAKKNYSEYKQQPKSEVRIPGSIFLNEVRLMNLKNMG